MRTMAGHAADVTARRDAVSGRDAVSVTRDRRGRLHAMVWASWQQAAPQLLFAILSTM